MAVTTVRNDALAVSTDVAQAGAGTAVPAGPQRGQGTASQSAGGQDAGTDTQDSGEPAHDLRPMPSLWNFVENEGGNHHVANTNQHQLKPMWHHA